MVLIGTFRMKRFQDVIMLKAQQKVWFGDWLPFCFKTAKSSIFVQYTVFAISEQIVILKTFQILNDILVFQF